jgi:hypothetical protein
MGPNRISNRQGKLACGMGRRDVYRRSGCFSAETICTQRCNGHLSPDALISQEHRGGRIAIEVRSPYLTGQDDAAIQGYFMSGDNVQL